jgi:Coenzyme PQQ synthesis protein D (PqqD).
MPATTHVWSEHVINLSSLFLKQNEDVHSAVLEGASVLLNLSTGRYYTLNAVGSIIWDMCSQDCPLAHVVSAICDKFDVTVQKAQDDLIDLVVQLEQEGLMHIERR